MLRTTGALLLTLRTAACSTDRPIRSGSDAGTPDESSPKRQTIPVEADFGRKVVYGTDPAAPVEQLRADCRQRGGSLNTCGTPCAPGAAVCAQVCAITCESTRGEGESTGSSAESDWPRYDAGAFSVRYQPAAAVDREGPGLIRFRLIGPDAKPATEVLDGFIFTIGARAGCQLARTPRRLPEHSFGRHGRLASSSHR